MVGFPLAADIPVAVLGPEFIHPHSSHVTRVAIQRPEVTKEEQQE
jgi:hypothetical protein